MFVETILTGATERLTDEKKTDQGESGRGLCVYECTYILRLRAEQVIGLY